jgi:hypothetical protein
MATTSVRPPPADVVGRQFVRDPDLWLTSVAILAAVFSVLQLFVYPMGRSLAEFAISGRELLLGGAPAKTFWSLRAPGIAILHAFVQRFLGPSTMAMRVVEIATLLVLAFATTKVMKRIADFERVGVVAASLALFVHAQLEFEHTGQPELYAACLVTLATLFTLRTPTRHNRFYHYAAVGFFVGMATVFVPLFWLVLLPLGYRIARFEAKEREGLAPVTAVLVAVLASLLLPLAVALWLHRHGALHVFVTDWVQPQIRLWFSWSPDGFVEWIYFLVDRLLLRQSAIIPAGCLVAFVLPGLHREEIHGLRLLLAIAGVIVFGFAITGESNPGRLSGVLPFLSMIAAVGIYKLYRKLLVQGPAALAAFWSGLFLLAALCTAVGVAPGSYWWRSWVRLKFLANVMPYHAVELLEGDLYSNGQINLPGARRVRSALERLQTPGDCFVHGDEPELAWMLKQRPRARLIRPLTDDLALAAPELDVKLSESLERLAPSCYVTSPWTAAMPPGSLATRLGPSRDHVAAHSELVSVVDGWAIWRVTSTSRP